jgi:hypothetical protein
MALIDIESAMKDGAVVLMGAMLLSSFIAGVMVAMTFTAWRERGKPHRAFQFQRWEHSDPVFEEDLIP